MAVRSSRGRQRTLDDRVIGRDIPAPRFVAWTEHRKDLARRRAESDEMKRILERYGHIFTCHSIAGNAIVRGERRKFSIDIYINKNLYSNQEMHIVLKRIYELMKRGNLPKEYYYAVNLSPYAVLRRPWIRASGITYMTTRRHSPSKRGRFRAG